MSWYSVIDNRYTVNGDWRLAAGIFSRCRFRTSVTLEVQYIGNTFWAESGKRSAHALEEE